MPCDIHKLSLRFTSNIAIIISHHFIKAVIQGATSYHLYKRFRTNSGRDWLPSRLTDLSAYNLIPLPNERISRCFLILKLLSHSATTSPNRSYRFISEPSRQMAWFFGIPLLTAILLWFPTPKASGCMARHHLYCHHDLNAAFNYHISQHTHRSSAIFAYAQSLRVWTEPNTRSIPRIPNPTNDTLHAPWLGHSHGYFVNVTRHSNKKIINHRPIKSSG